MKAQVQRKVAPLISGLLVLGFIAVVSVAASPKANSDTPVSLTADNSILSAADQDQLGFHVQPLPAISKAAAVSSSVAIERAAPFFGATEQPTEVLHVLAAPDAALAERGVYVVIWKGGEPIPGGPEGNKPHSIDYRGVVIDDQTGEILRAFSSGTQ